MSKLDEKGRCCGRKPLVYKRDHHLFCSRCDRSFSLVGAQIENWAWRRLPDNTFERKANPSAPQSPKADG